jgi:hypothetical protein
MGEKGGDGNSTLLHGKYDWGGFWVTVLSLTWTSSPTAAMCDTCDNLDRHIWNIRREKKKKNSLQDFAEIWRVSTESLLKEYFGKKKKNQKWSRACDHCLSVNDGLTDKVLRLRDFKILRS